MLTPADIEKIEFSATRVKAGYDQNEVDNFLDRVAADYQLALTQLEDEKNAHIRDRQAAAVVQRQLDSYGDQPTAIMPAVSAGFGDVTKLLAAAQQTADQLTANAEAEARSTIGKANIEASAIVAEATQKADAARQEAEAKLYAAQTKLSALNEAHAQTRTFLANTLNSAISALDERPPS